MDQRKQKEFAYSNEPIEISSVATPPAEPEELEPPSEAPEGEAPLEVTEAAEVSDPFEPTEGAVPYEATEGEASLETTETIVEEPLTEPLEATETAASYEATEGEAPLDITEAPAATEPEAAEAQAPNEAAEGEAPLEATEVTEIAEPVEALEAVAPTETAETASWSEPARSPLASTAPPPSFDESSASARFAEFLQFLDRTKRLWVIAASAIFVLLVVAFAAKRVSEWTRVPQAAPHSVMATTITPEVLTTHCGQPAADVTTEMYPLLTRTMTYEASGNQTYIFSFSRTAEKNSEWVFLSMKDASGTNSYDTPEAEVAAMACLNSGK